jgi:hypothetical protein
MGLRADLSGKAFGRWVVIDYSHKNTRGEIYWNCVCECGSKKPVTAGSLRKGTSVSCGCLHKEAVTTHGMTGTKTFKSWDSMKQRCMNPKSPDYHRYGARGIAVCERWINSFDNFLLDMGLRPDKKTLDRIDVNGNYEPSNCKWSTYSEQNKNQRRYLKVT